MGPRSIDRGIQRGGHQLPWNLQLQWGRDQLIAEFYDGATLTLGLLSLQWGRDQLIAEFRAAWKRTKPKPSFNGAAIN